MSEPDITVVIPCLNEERTVARVVEAARDGIRAAGLRGEILVCDNGSTDRSRERAEAAGARIVHVARRGYGAALQAGFLAGRGRLMVMGDADLSYDFRHIPRFVEEIDRSGADMVVGNRFAGGIMRGAMPLSHRLIGNPLVSWTVRRITGVRVGDCYCGLRMITQTAHRRLLMTSTGMEYALEMIVKASLAGMKIAEAPTTLRVDGRDHAPHLRTVSDGYRSFRFLFQHAPIKAFIFPGLLLALAGALGLAAGAAVELRTGRPAFGPAIAAAALSHLAGGTLLISGLISRMFASGYLGHRVDMSLKRFFSVLHLESAVLLALLGFAGGIAAMGFGMNRSQSLLILGVTTTALSLMALFSSFVVSLMGRAVPDNRFYLDGAVSAPPAGERPSESAPGSSAPGGQNVAHSLATQEALAHAPRYNAWLFETVAPALEGARLVLDIGCSTGNISVMAADRLRGRAGEVADGPRGVVGLEVIPEAFERFRDRFAGRDDLIAVLGDIADPPRALSELAPYDAAISLNVLEHIEDDIGALQTIGSLLRPGGRLGLLVPGGGDRLFGTLDALDRHFRRYTPARLRLRLEEAGFEVISLRPVNFAGYFLWLFKGRVLRSKAIHPGEVRAFDRWVPLLRGLDRLLGPPTGQSLAAVARWVGKSARTGLAGPR